jgi:hypothetical protein
MTIPTFNWAFDGVTDDSAAWTAAWNYAKANGVVIDLPAGTSNAGTFRAYFQGATNGFGFRGQGKGVTILKFADLPMSSSNNVEPSLFDVNGTDTAPARNIVLEGFSLDYSAQTNKGGASLSTLSQTDIVPYGISMMGIAFTKCLNLKIRDIGMTEIYGDGVRGSDSPFTDISNVALYNVSGGNPGSDDSRGGAISVFRSFGSKIDNCSAVNLRTYQTDHIAGYNSITAKNTPCGYIGIWNEFRQGHDTGDGNGPPTWYTDMWLSGSYATDAANYANPETMGVVISNCWVWGYTLGFKAEDQCPTLFSNNTALNCWIPHIATGSSSEFVNCYADAMSLDGQTCPMDGYDWVKALFVQYKPETGTEDGYAGTLFDGCRGYTRYTRVFVDAAGYGRFLNQHTILDSPTTTSLFETVSGAVVYGTQITGHVEIKRQGQNGAGLLTDMAHGTVDLTVSNLSSYAYTFGFNGYYGGATGTKVKIRAKGLVHVTVDAGLNNGEVDFAVDCLDTTLQSTATNSAWIGGHNTKVKLVFNVHTKFVPATTWLSEANAGHKVEAAYNLTDGGANNFAQGLLYLNGDNIEVTSAIKYSDPYNNPLLALPQTKGLHVEEARNLNDTGPLFTLLAQPNGPLTLGRKLQAANLWAGGTAPATEPNSLAKLAQGVWYPAGLDLPYVNQALSGKQGVHCITSGQVANTKWVASTAVTVGTLLRTTSKVYNVTTAGTLGTTAPTATGTNITNGTAKLAYVGPAAQFVEYGSLAATALT